MKETSIDRQQLKALLKKNVVSFDPSRAAPDSLFRLRDAYGPHGAQIEQAITKAGKITNSEQVPLDGQPTSHYTIDLDFAKMLDEATGQIPGAAGDEVKNKLQGKDLHVPAELWLNSDQLPVQMVMDMSKVMSAAGAPATGEAKTTVKYTDWGSAVDIHEPPADQVTDFGALMRGA